MGPWERKIMVLKKRAFLNEAFSDKGSTSLPLRGLEDLRMPSLHQKIRLKPASPPNKGDVSEVGQALEFGHA